MSETNKMPYLVGLTGPAGVGKDTVAGFLGWPTFAFAKTLKLMLAAAGLPEPATREDKEAIIPELGFSWRQAAQTLGTEWGRGLNPDLWLLLAKRYALNSGYTVLVITDVRFENEAQLVREHGCLIHVSGRETTASGAAAAHASEEGVAVGLSDWGIANSGTLEELRETVESLKEELRKGMW